LNPDFYGIPSVLLIVALLVVMGASVALLARYLNDYQNPSRAIYRRHERQEKKRIKEQAKQAKALADIKRNADTPPSKMQGAPDAQNASSALEEESIGEFVNFEIGKEKNGKRVTVVRGRLRVRPDRWGRLRDKFLFQWDKGGYFVRLDKLIEVDVKKGLMNKTTEKTRKLVYDILYSEPLAQNGQVTWDDQLEEILTDAGAGQYIDAATFEGGFQLTPALLRTVVIIGILGSFLGLALNGSLHVIPTTIVHWVP
jgi:hypothetical protein